MQIISRNLLAQATENWIKNNLKDTYLRESASASVHGIRDLFFLFISAIKVDTKVFSSQFFL